eukprot:CAMPEP_0178381212 /NCGR_PEP_ID=MMETSP0689_2-20121128/5864_1 /TAXON_ID=160604 /ORGANISM="Amphidinium massartii, Strain CS-259" /LENGTH=411 /DNA_ID=CAMNT_0020001383 /DNA_START=52 /DNA_END=1283 /DNA_ORIENTATION=+
MVAKEVLGALVMSSLGILDTALVVSYRVFLDRQWPAIRLQAFAFFLVSVALSAGLCIVRLPAPEKKHRKWIALRGVCGILAFAFDILATRTGMAAGDLAALTSVNTVISAILGRVFLGEVLGFAHVISMVSSVVGAVLLTKPGPLSTTGAQSVSPLGVVLAAASGFATASLFICSRKSAKISPLYLCTGTAVVGCPLLWLVAALPMVDDFSLSQPLQEEPGLFVFAILALSVLSLVAILCLSAAAQWCPAVVSATVNTGARMVVGYVAQALFFGLTPEPITLVGASLLFVSVVVVAWARVPEAARLAASGSETNLSPSTAATSDSSGCVVATGSSCTQAEAATVAGQCQDDSVPDGAAVEEVDEDDEESLAHFVAAEFVEYAPHHAPLRQRRDGKARHPGNGPGAQMLGAG